MTSAGCEINDASTPETTPQPKLHRDPKTSQIRNIETQILHIPYIKITHLLVAVNLRPTLLQCAFTDNPHFP